MIIDSIIMNIHYLVVTPTSNNMQLSIIFNLMVITIRDTYWGYPPTGSDIKQALSGVYYYLKGKE